MALNPEWKRRIETWTYKLADFFYSPLDTLELDGFVTRELLTIGKVDEKSFQKMPVGTIWGGMWEYGWFKTGVIIPATAKDRLVVLKIDTGAESAVYVNGINAGAFDEFHREIILTSRAVPGTEYDILIESYAGHGVRQCHAGPVEPGRETVPVPSEPQAVIGSSTFGLWNEEVYQLWLDVKTLYQIRCNIDKESLRVCEIDKALKEFTLMVDFELEFDDMIETVKQCRKHLAPLLECVNGTTIPTMFVFGHSHIDVAWLWPLAETERKCSRTFATQIELMKLYPEYKFLQSQPHLYRMVKRNYPALYDRIKEAVQNSQFIPDGGMWVEPDTNIPSGEALIRQFIHGKRFFRDEFGIDSRVCWLPDVFGYTGAFPQIIKGCDMDYFSTQKIFWTYNGGHQFPYHTFWWEGIDGTKVLSHIHNDYNSHTEPGILIQRWNERVQKDGISTRLFPFGYGDGGGGPTRDHLEYIRRTKNLEGVPKTQMCEPAEFFEDLKERGIPGEIYVGELYFQAHRGTYTSQAKTKMLNRMCEFALREAEIWGVISNVMNGFCFDNMTLDEQWKTVLLNQFHDILPGSSIQRVYKEAEAAYEKTLSDVNNIRFNALQSITGKKNAVTVFNSLSWQSKKLISLPEEFRGAEDISGNALMVQQDNDAVYTEVSVPACGWTTVYPSDMPETESKNVIAEKDRLENELISIRFDENGEIKSIFDRKNCRELAASNCNAFKMYKDVPTLYDAWDIDSMYENTHVEIASVATIEVVSSGPLFAKIRIKKTLNNSKMEQEVILRRNSRRVDFKTKIDWQESHKLLKVNFPVNVHSNEAVQEIQFGYIKRPNHYSSDFDKARFEVCNHKWSALVEENHGFAVLNDSKYGLNVHENSINLTLLKSALAPDMYADKGMQDFTYSIYIWEGSFSKSNIVREGYELNTNPPVIRGEAMEESIFTVDSENIIIDTVKFAEDGSGDIILRLYESMHMTAKCNLTSSLPFKRCSQTNMMEKHQKDLDFNRKTIELNFRPFEIKTVRLKMN